MMDIIFGIIGAIFVVFCLIALIERYSGKMTEEEFDETWADFHGNIRTHSYYIQATARKGGTVFEINTTWAGESREQAIWKMHCEMCESVFRAGKTPPEVKRKEKS